MAIHTDKATLPAEDMETVEPSGKAIADAEAPKADAEVDAEALKADEEALTMDAAMTLTTSLSLPSRTTPSNIPQRDIRRAHNLIKYLG